MLFEFHGDTGTCVPECPQYGVCHHCGQTTNIARFTNKSRHVVQGRYSIWKSGHFHPVGGPGCMATNGVPIAKVRPLIQYLVRVYGGPDNLSRVLGIPQGTINGHLYKKDVGKINPKTAKQYSDAVLRHRKQTQDPLLIEREDVRMPTKKTLIQMADDYIREMTG
jgi:hypothetical protein